MVAHILLAAALQAASPDAAAEEAVIDSVPANEVDEATIENALPKTSTETEEAPTPPAIMIPRDTPVHLMVINEVSTKDHDVGHTFTLRVDKPVVIDGRELIPVGTTAWGRLTAASNSGNVGRSGKLEATLTHIDLDGREIPIEGGTTADGKSGKGETLLGVLAMGPLGLFAKGNNAKIKAGERMTAFVAEDVVLNDAE